MFISNYFYQSPSDDFGRKNITPFINYPVN
ncbi:hypothetical protein SAMN05216463_10837 [Xylanibacter ruminicola]|uniref:Uncharacterized protein n=1 Tax=Xylanibacter ruminicola TaxID=839 RepID=A0A1M6U5P9_XYLRU|nr:hypothetical protein SAMN05216463_10837 [Xylanibacter ruminicola]